MHFATHATYMHILEWIVLSLMHVIVYIVTIIALCVVYTGLAILLPFMLSQHRLWKNCKLRIFTAGSSRNIDSARLKYDSCHVMYSVILGYMIV